MRRVIDFEFVKPPAHVMAELGVDRVLRVKRINLADGEPFAVVTVWCPAELGQHLSMADVERRPFYELLDIELRGATQTIGADLAEPPDAELLAVPVGSPLLRVPARHHRHERAAGADERAPLPGPSHRVRRRPPERSAVVGADRPAAGRQRLISCRRSTSTTTPTMSRIGRSCRRSARVTNRGSSMTRAGVHLPERCCPSPTRSAEQPQSTRLRSRTPARWCRGCSRRPARRVVVARWWGADGGRWRRWWDVAHGDV